MKGLLATTAVLGVLAIGGLPALALTLAAEETGPAAEPTTTLVEDEVGDGEPPGWARGADREPPPGWTRNHAGAEPYGWTVRAWASCRAQAGRGPDARTEAEARCGDKPAKPAKAAKAAKPAKPAKAAKAAKPAKAAKAAKPAKPAKPKAG